MDFIKKLVHILANISYVLIIIYLIIWLPSLFGYKPLVVLSGSMSPTFEKGDVIYYHEASQNEIKVGDAITFKLEDTIVTHRINEIDEDGMYVTKGDANETVDPVKINYSNILGKDLNFKIMFVGYFIKYINEHAWTIITVFVVLCLEFILSNLDTGKKKGEKKDGKEE